MPARLMLLAIGLGVGGTETHILELASRIDRSRYDVTVCCLKTAGCLADELRARGVRVVSLNGTGKLDALVLFRLWKLVRRERPDVIQAFLFWANMAARLLGRAMKAVPVISSYHDEVVSEGWLIRALDRLTFGWSHTIVCCSEAVRRSVSSQVCARPARYTIIPFGLDPQQFNPSDAATRQELGLSQDLPVLGTVCRLVEPKKGLSILLQALAEMRRREGSPLCQILIVGDGPARDMLQTMSEHLGIASRVVFAGCRRDIPRVLPLLHGFVMPSLYEGFGIAILEAMASGKAVIATAVGGIPEFVKQGETGLLVEPGSPLALAEAMTTLLRDQESARRMGSRGRDFVRDNFGIATVVRRHEQVYDACLAHA
ncbi:putative GDP-mannose-dependent alpha-(1-6)-phosphatidylinositol monomannoside mannosyltransferase [Nitrospira japonica]|uniref:Putative GDP-mannose-dependent alpha-(1-6)-phosphatidylinositol monomannoside mannosyltransferase n=1 Tax=Nitrospira japonica TaxID=1325564 RepID=A0A1W1I071_9BACT|nr:glycosyltransferase [Nitrospira japonica]SLM46405.1 putative GDP-mannose-dependent alpha-(1-6)-phosphatidylinositol monomannoside mannosyltransferase [Nitrospira japonica]